MKVLKFTIAALSSCLASSIDTQAEQGVISIDPTPEQRETYSLWASLLEPFEQVYAWTPFRFTTDDGYIITAFKISRRDKSPD